MKKTPKIKLKNRGKCIVKYVNRLMIIIVVMVNVVSGNCQETKGLNFFEDTKAESSIIFFPEKVSLSFNTAQTGITLKFNNIAKKDASTVVYSAAGNVFSTQGIINLIAKGEVEPGVKLKGIIGLRTRDTTRRVLGILPLQVFLVYIGMNTGFEKYKMYNEKSGFDRQLYDTTFFNYSFLIGMSGISTNFRWGMSIGLRNYNNIDQMENVETTDYKVVSMDTANSVTRAIVKQTGAYDGDYKKFIDIGFINIDIYYVFNRILFIPKHKIGLYTYYRNYKSKKITENEDDPFRANTFGLGLYYNPDDYYSPKFGILIESNSFKRSKELLLKDFKINFIGGIGL
ncbi:MAG: hypothetical protein IAE93_00565 [Ignavibacteria bacterium]|nr:hypothetical protein [Ignavibacteria bacterium]